MSAFEPGDLVTKVKQYKYKPGDVVLNKCREVRIIKDFKTFEYGSDRGPAYWFTNGLWDREGNILGFATANDITESKDEEEPVNNTEIQDKLTSAETKLAQAEAERDYYKKRAESFETTTKSLVADREHALKQRDDYLEKLAEVNKQVNSHAKAAFDAKATADAVISGYNDLTKQVQRRLKVALFVILANLLSASLSLGVGLYDRVMKPAVAAQPVVVEPVAKPKVEPGKVWF